MISDIQEDIQRNNSKKCVDNRVHLRPELVYDRNEKRRA
jgi:hypothetical protein